jgi:hypothetical protein
MTSSGGPPIVPSLPADNIESDISSPDGSDMTQSDELACPDDYSDAPEEQTASVLGFE